MSMSDDLLREVLDRLDEFKFKPRQGWLRQGVCPSCKQKELYTHADSPWVLKCGRLNNCGYEAHIKDLYPDLFDHWSKRYQAEPTKNPNAAADAYLSMARGFDLDLIRGSYTQENYFDGRRQIGSATVRFSVGSAWWQRLIDQPERFGKMKAYFQPGATYKGQWWAMPRQDLAAADVVWIVEGIFDAIALAHHGITAVAAMSCSNYPGAALADLLAARDGRPGNLVFALDGDKAGMGYMKKHVARAKADGWGARAAYIPQRGPRKRDWNDLHLLDAGDEPHGRRLAAAVDGILSWTAGVPHEGIHATVEGHRVVLTGEVAWDAERVAAKRAVERIHGVHSVDSRIELTRRPQADDVAEEIRNALVRNAILDSGHIVVAVDGDEVALTGAVSSWIEHQQALRTVWSSPHVRQVHDGLRVEPGQL